MGRIHNKQRNEDELLRKKLNQLWENKNAVTPWRYIPERNITVTKEGNKNKFFQKKISSYLLFQEKLTKDECKEFIEKYGFVKKTLKFGNENYDDPNGGWDIREMENNATGEDIRYLATVTIKSATDFNHDKQLQEYPLELEPIRTDEEYTSNSDDDLPPDLQNIINTDDEYVEDSVPIFTP